MILAKFCPALVEKTLSSNSTNTVGQAKAEKEVS